MISDFFKRDYPLPPFSFKTASRLALLILLPNLIFWLLAWKTNTARPFINIDYGIALIFMFFQNKISKMIGILLFIIMCIGDILMTVVQIFPFLDIAAIRYFLPFIWVAPSNYLIAMGIGVIVVLALPPMLLKIGKNQSSFYMIVVNVFLLLFGSLFGELRYAEFDGIMGRNHYFYANSQINLFRQTMQNDFVSAGKTKSEIRPLSEKQENAASRLSKPYANKILLIVAESWGSLRQPDALEDLLKNINNQKDKLDFVESDNFYLHTATSTVHGEMRELCRHDIFYGFALGQVADAQFTNCLPNILKQQGYQTIAVHGASGQLYDRHAWYPKAGFSHTIFSESLLERRRCTAFLGVCDSEITQYVIPDYFTQHQQDKIFFYWLTLTAHQPYAAKDIVNSRFDCGKYGLQNNGELCRNFQLNTQLIDNVAELIKQPEMRGTEVMIVGDHMPPLISGEDFKSHLYGRRVGLLHFKIKN